MNKLMKIKKDKKGFTLIEIIIVVVIIAILAAMLIPNMATWIKKSKHETFRSEASSVKQAVTSELVDLYADGTSVTSQANLPAESLKSINEKCDRNFTTDNIHFESTNDNNITKFTYDNSQFKLTYQNGGWDKEVKTGTANNDPKAAPKK